MSASSNIDWFRFIIFMLHFVAACTITFFVLLRCDQSVFTAKVYIDTISHESGLLPFVLQDSSVLNHTCYSDTYDREKCFRQGLPIYEKEIEYLGWHVFVLLAYFEWVSSAFAFLYIKRTTGNHAWIASILIVIVGTLLCMPWNMRVYVNEILFIGYSTVACIVVFYLMRHQCNTYKEIERVEANEDEESDTTQLLPEIPDNFSFDIQPPSAPQQANTFALHHTTVNHGQGLLSKMNSVMHNRHSPEDGHRYLRIPKHFGSRSSTTLHAMILSSQDLHPGIATNITDAYAPILRFTEYSITAAFLFVAVLCIFAPDTPAFMAFLGFYSVCTCNVLGVLMHYGVLMHNADSNNTWLKSEYKQKKQNKLNFLNIPLNGSPPNQNNSITIPSATTMTPDQDDNTPTTTPPNKQQNSILLNCDLFHSWLAYVCALLILGYQGNLLLSHRAPWFVVFSAWMLLVSYSSFGIWATVAYKLPWLLSQKWLRVMCVSKTKTVGQILVRGLDILSLAAKLSIVMSLASGFVFQGTCK